MLLSKLMPEMPVNRALEPVPSAVAETVLDPARLVVVRVARSYFLISVAVK